jgi:biotin transport system substrate-specific component
MSADAATSVRPSSPATDLALIAVFAGLIAAFALAPAIPIGALGVPITLQTLAVALTGMVLGPKRGFLAVLLYLVVGLAGLPVFAGGAAGLGVFAKPSIGYLLSFPFAAALTGFLSYRILDRRPKGLWAWLAGAGLTASILLVHPLGIAGMATILHLDLRTALIADLPFWPGDVLKNLAAGFVAAQVHRAFPALASRR